MIQVQDIEMVILGVIQKRGPCTPYNVRKEFATSPSSHFSSSPGSIYPIIKRLEKQKLLKSKSDPVGNRPRKLYRITNSGKNALRSWLTPPFPPDIAGMTFDPIRTRIYFLQTLTRPQRSKFLQAAASDLAASITTAQNDLKRYQNAHDTYSAWAAQGALELQRARLSWIKKLTNQFETLPTN